MYDWLDCVLWGIIVICAIAILALVGLFVYDLCRSPETLTGVVVGKHIEEEHTETIIMPIFTGDILIMIPTFQHHPQRNMIRVEGEKSGEINVELEKFESLKIGDKVVNLVENK